MPLDIEREINALKPLSLPALKARYTELFGEMPRCRHRLWLVRRIAWRLQALNEGDLSERARQRAHELANDADLRLLPPRETAGNSPRQLPENTTDRRLPPPGTVVTRDYKGRTICVTVLAEGFEFESQAYSSLSAIAKLVTGAHWNGFHFFGLRKKASKT